MNPIVLRITIIAIALAIWFWTQKLIGGMTNDKDGIGDAIHRLTARWHRYFFEHEKAANRALIISSLGIDAMGLALIAIAVFSGTFAPFVAIIIVFSMRQLCQACCTLPPPPGIIWRNPGFPSLLVTYGVSNDLFFSGHTALAVLGALEITQHAPPWLGALAVLVASGEILIVLTLRAHYTMDIIAGAFAAWFAADIADHLSPLIDGWLS